MRAGIYARISEDRDETQLGVQRQIADCERLTELKGWEVADRYVDNDVSAYRVAQRPEYRRLLADITAGRVEAVVVYHQDRLHRQPRELEEFFDVCDAAGLVNLATVSGEVDLATHDGRMHARIMGAVARNQSDAASRRIRRKAQETAAAGLPGGGGDRPFGFELDRITVRESEAEIIRELASRLLAGETLRSLAIDLNERGIPTTGRSEKWVPIVVKRMLASGRISGQREHHGTIVATAVWPAIISPADTQRIRALFADPSRRAARPARRYLLKGMVRCARCDFVMVARPVADGRRAYVCARDPQNSGCGRMKALAEPLEELITEAVILRLDSQEFSEALRGQQPPADEWQARAELLAGKLKALAEAFGQHQIAMPEWFAARDPLQRELDAARRRINRNTHATILAEHAGRGEDLRADWSELGLDRRRRIIEAAVLHVVVRPGRRGYNRFDPTRFDVLWRAQ